MNKTIKVFQNINPTECHRLSVGSWISGVPYTLVVTRDYAKIELAIMHKSTQEECKKIYDSLLQTKDEIEHKFWHNLSRERLDDGKGSRIAFYLRWVNKFEKNDRQKIIDFFTNNISWFIESVKPSLYKITN